MYKFLLRPILFLIDPEKVHHLVFTLLKFPGLKILMRLLFRYDNASLSKEVFGLKFRNPVGLAAGFDKDAKLIHELAGLGFGFIEIGTLTPRPQSGNPKPRLFRIPDDEGLINRMGFNNEGVLNAVERLKKKCLNKTIDKNCRTETELRPGVFNQFAKVPHQKLTIR